MNLKDRLESIKKTNIISIKEEDEKKDFLFGLSDIFADSKELRTIITETIASGKNIVFVSEPSIDKYLVSKYFSCLLFNRPEEVVVSETLTDEVLYSNSRINIIPKPTIQEIVKILEYIMYGYKSFVFGMNFASLDNILNKIKAAISLNVSGLSIETINTILVSSNLVVVYLNKNVDGLFYISKIDKVVCEDFVPEVITIIDFQQQEPLTKKNRKFKKIVKAQKVEEKQVPQKEQDVVLEILADDKLEQIETANDIENLTETNDFDSVDKGLVLEEAVDLEQKEDILVEEKIEVVSTEENNSELETPTEIIEEQKVEKIDDEVVLENVEEEVPLDVLDESSVEEASTEIVIDNIEEEKTVVDVPESPVEDVSTEVVVENIEEEKTVKVVNSEEILKEQKDIIAEISQKVNKYKLLKEKAKNKKVDITE